VPLLLTQQLSPTEKQWERRENLCKMPRNQMDSDLSARCTAKAKELARLYEAEEPPFKLTELLGKYGVSEVRRRPLNGDARLLAEGDGFVIEINSIFPRVRQRLSLAHEIGHLILNECSGRDLHYPGHSDSGFEN